MLCMDVVFDIGALVVLYPRLTLGGTRVLRGLELGVIGYTIGQLPLWLLWYAEQPWPDALVVKQLLLELLSSLLTGATIGLASGSRVPGPSIRTADQGWTD